MSSVSILQLCLALLHYMLKDPDSALHRPEMYPAQIRNVLLLILGVFLWILLCLGCCWYSHRHMRNKWERRKDAINALRIQRVADRGTVELPGRLRRYDTQALDDAYRQCNEQIAMLESFWPSCRRPPLSDEREGGINAGEGQRRPQNQTRSARAALEEDLVAFHSR